MKVIETNISLDDNDNMAGFQSRVISVDSWEDFIDEVREAKTVVRSAVIGTMYGNTIPRSSMIENLLYDDHSLSCDISNYRGLKSKKLAYLIIE